MIPQVLEGLKDFILSKNTVFHNGYANAYRNELRYTIYTKTGNELLPLLPNDTLGNYFYLRHEDAIQHEPSSAERLADSGSGRLSFLDTIIIQLVAFADKACAYTLIDNLRNTLMMFDGLHAQPITSMFESTKILVAELPKISNEQQHALLQRVKDETIIRITLKASLLFTPSNCINNACN
jgi:hypothetical protein